MMRRALPGFFNFAVFAGALAAGCLLLHPVQPFAGVTEVGEKLEGFAARRDEFTTLFVGSSRVRRHIIPSLFDRLAAERGSRERSYNLGIDAMAAPEDDFLLDRVLETRPPRLRWVVVELSYFRSNFAGQAPETGRAVYWRDWERTTQLWRQLVQVQMKPLKKKRWKKWLADNQVVFGLMAQNGRLFLQHFANLGRGATAFAELIRDSPPNDLALLLGPELDGFNPRDDEVVMTGAQYESFVESLAARQQEPAKRRTFDAVAQQGLEKMVAKIRASGAEPILFIAPTLQAFHVHPAREVAPLLDFSNPQEWPDLFDPRHRGDPGHLNTLGAAVFTRRLAERFALLRSAPLEQR